MVTCVSRQAARAPRSQAAFASKWRAVPHDRAHAAGRRPGTRLCAGGSHGLERTRHPRVRHRQQIYDPGSQRGRSHCNHRSPWLCRRWSSGGVAPAAQPDRVALPRNRTRHRACRPFGPGGAARLFLLLPNGHLPSRRWRPVAVATLLLAAFFVVPIGMLAPTGISVNETSSPMVQNPIGVSALSAISFSGSLVMVTVSLFVVSLLLLLVAGAAPLGRMRRSEGDERQQMKWIAYAIVVTVIVTTPLAIVTWGFAILPSLTWLTDLAIAAGFGIALPVAAGVAIFKHRLYDIDIVISRTLVYGALAVFITAVYFGIAVGIGALIGGGGKPNLGLSILATAIVALGFQPARERLQKVANRLVYGKRATPYEVLSEFSGRVAETYAAEDVLPRMARVLQEGTGAQLAVVWLRHDQQIRPAATHPEAANGLASVPMREGTLPALSGATRSVEVRHQGELLGALSVNKRRGEALTPIELKLVDELAHHAGLE